MFETLYVTLVLATGGYALIRTLAFLGAIKARRLANVAKRKRFEPIKGETPIEDPKAVARERAVEGIETQFTVLRRLLVPAIVSTTLLLASIPLLAAASAATVSVLSAAIALLIGLAVRPFFENAISGLVISSSGLLRIGDTVRIDEFYGTVEDITPTHTTIRVWDWRRYLVPNTKMLQSPFLNYSLHDTFRWAYVEFHVAPDAPLDVVRALAIRAPERSSFYARHEPPRFWVMDMHRDSIRCWIAAWADSPSDAWALSHDVRTELVRAFQEHGIPTCLLRVEASSPAEERAQQPTEPTRG